jgi:uncharacterized protein YbgA (DUF1722 family)
MAHNPVQYKALGKPARQHGPRPIPAELGPRYFSELMAALKKCATRGTHSNVLQHISGYLKQAISAEDKQEVLHVISQYRHGIVPLGSATDAAQTSLSPTPGPLHCAAGLPATASGKPQLAKCHLMNDRP